MTNLFNEDYFENGVKKGISGYENYHYIPERSYSEAISIAQFCSLPNTFLDFGCGKGYLVHALRQLGIDAYGEDISDYALSNCHPRVKGFVSRPTTRFFDFIFAKDVLEHVPNLQETLSALRERCDHGLFVVPLGDNGVYRIREYEVDKTHLIKEDEDFWIDNFRKAGFDFVDFSYSLGHIKEKWLSVHPFGNGFFRVY